MPREPVVAHRVARRVGRGHVPTSTLTASSAATHCPFPDSGISGRVHRAVEAREAWAHDAGVTLSGKGTT